MPGRNQINKKMRLLNQCDLQLTQTVPAWICFATRIARERSLVKMAEARPCERYISVRSTKHLAATYVFGVVGLRREPSARVQTKSIRLNSPSLRPRPHP